MSDPWTNLFPFDHDANDSTARGVTVGPFLYIGQALTAAEFATYVKSYNFGRIEPSYIVLHHTANPSASWAPMKGSAIWDANEAGMSEAKIKAKRLRQLFNIANYYQHTLGWDRGFHLAIDDRWVYLFTPMNAVGIHAKEGNSYGSGAGLHYSIGVEVIGYYEHVTWPAPVAANVRAALQALGTRLGIALKYTPGPLHSPAAHDKQLSSHRDYNKPGCPGKAITEAYYTSVVQPATLHTVIAGAHGAIAQQDRRPGALAARYYPAGTKIVCDDLTAGYLHDHTGAGFIPQGQVEG